MVEWFDDLKVGMRFKSEATTVSKDDILRFVDRLQSKWRGGLHVQTHRHRAGPAGVSGPAPGATPACQ
jgi:hypothetical protein